MSESIPLKHCPACDKDLPPTPEFFHVHQSTHDKLRKECKNCRNQQKKQQYHFNPEVKTRANAQAKVWEDAHKESRAAHRENNREHKREYDKRYAQKNKDKKRAYRIGNKQRIDLHHSLYYQTHIERYREQDKAYRQTARGREVGKAKEHRRHMRKKAIPGTLTAQEIRQKLRAQKYRCYYAGCGHAKFECVKGKYVYHLEHTIPVSRSEANPRHDVNFVVLSCPSCNIKKHDKLPHEFFDGGRLL